MQCNELELLPGISQLSHSLNEACIEEIKGSLSLPVLGRKVSVSDLVCTPQGLARIGGKSSLLGVGTGDLGQSLLCLLELLLQPAVCLCIEA